MRVTVGAKGHQSLIVVASIAQRARVIELHLVAKTIPLVAALRTAVLELRQDSEALLLADLLRRFLIRAITTWCVYDASPSPRKGAS